MKKILVPALLLVAATAVADSPFATSVVASTGLSGSGTYNDPSAVLGKPTTRFGSPGFYERAKLIEGIYGNDPSGGKLITTIGEGQSLTVAFDHDVVDDPKNPFGLDFIVFGNSFLLGNDFGSEDTNLNTFILQASALNEPMQISVSPNNVDWYTYADGPYGDTLMPTNAYRWDRANAAWTDEEMDWTKPVDPRLTLDDLGGMSAADALDLYRGSAGGTGFDLAPSGFAAIRYIRVTGVTGFAGGEIDGFSDVAPVPEPASLTALALGGWALLRRRRQ